MREKPHRNFNRLSECFSRCRMITMLLATLILLSLLLISSWALLVFRFFLLMSEVPVWTAVPPHIKAETYPIGQVQQAACFLMNQSERKRSGIIATYNSYGQYYDASSPEKLYLLLRVLFEVPENHSIDDAAIFGGWIGEGSPYPQSEQEGVNLLWPLGYQDNRLVLKAKYVQYLGPPYNGLAEYKYFASRFPFRFQSCTELS